MDRRLSGLSLAGIIGLAAAGADAGTLTGATWSQVTGANGIGVGFAVPMTRTFSQLGASGTSTATSISVSLSYPQFTTSLFVPKNLTLSVHVRITQGGPQAITATAGMAVGSPGVPGTVVIMTAGHAAMGVNQSMFKVGVNTLVSVPLSIGGTGMFGIGRSTSDGSPGSTFWTILGAIHVGTISFFAWTPGTLTFSGLTSMGVALPSVVAMGSFGLTPMGGGTVTLVAPSKLSIDGTLWGRRTASFTTLVLTFVPEPGACLLLAGGGAALAWIGRRRRA